MRNRISIKYDLLCCVVVLGLLLAACGPEAATSAPETPTPEQAAAEAITLNVFAAASLTDAFSAIAEVYEAEHPGVDVVLQFASSSTLAAQIGQGAPADVYASANPNQMAVAVESGRVAEDAVVTFAGNRLVLIVPAQNPAAIESVADLATGEVALVLAAPDVPVRVYTDQLLVALSAEPDYGAGFPAAVLANLVSEEPNVRQVVARVALGEADAAIVYSSDVTPDVAGDLQAIALPEAVNPTASYPIAPLSDSAQAEQAQSFVDYVLSEAGQAILTGWGFLPAP
ncbi:MAG: molybdate ABC transporter substrate-binding protein [Anaerolineae bacterium]|nr:molybdate ABC transporter substrate-binding protein [Anaerolineae bacterium]